MQIDVNRKIAEPFHSHLVGVLFPLLEQAMHKSQEPGHKARASKSLPLSPKLMPIPKNTGETRKH